jgi:hypothetical protein
MKLFGYVHVGATCEADRLPRRRARRVFRRNRLIEGGEAEYIVKNEPREGAGQSCTQRGLQSGGRHESPDHSDGGRDTIAEFAVLPGGKDVSGAS